MTIAQIAGIFWRSMFLQSAWNFKKLQNVGFALCVDPWLRRIHSGEDLKAARLRALEAFSTQAHMAPLVAGMFCGLEEDAARAPAPERMAKRERLVALRSAAAAALAGVGDALFWSALRPLSAGLGLAAAMLFWDRGPETACLASAGIMLAAFNIPGLALRAAGPWLGYAEKEEIALRLKEWPWQKTIRGLRLTGAVLTLALAWSVSAGWVSAAALAAIFGVKKATGFSGLRLYAACAVAAAAMAWSGARAPAWDGALAAAWERP